jgi:hypothetical protein
MKLKNVKTSDLSTGAAQVLGAGIGFMLPNGVANAALKITDDKMVSDDQKMKKMYINALMVGLGVYGAVAIDGNDMTAVALKSLSLGIAGGGVKGLAQHFLEKTVATTDPNTSVGTLLRGSLGCGCSNNNMATLQGAKRYARRSLAMPSFLNEERSARPTVIDLANLSSVRDLAN